MLRIVAHTSSAAAKSYYRSADYYEDESRGQWGGKGAERLGLVGEVSKEAFDSLCDNRIPGTGEPLTVRTKGERRVGYDFTFNAPKSVSVLHALTGDTRIIEAFREAVQATLTDMEKEAKTRVRIHGQQDERLTGEMIWGEFVHTTSRPVEGIPDPHLHCHAFVINATYDPKENRWKAIEVGSLKRDAPYFEALFHSRLSQGLASMGYDVERSPKGWELAGVPSRLVKEFSRRTAEIEKLAQEKGITDPKVKDGLGAKSRAGKQHDLTPEQLRQAWWERLTPAEQEAIFAVTTGSHRLAGVWDPERESRRSLDYAIEHLFARDAVVAERELITEALRHGAGLASPEAILAAFTKSDLIRAEIDGQSVVTTPKALAEEQTMIRFARETRGNCVPLGQGQSHRFQREFLNTDQRKAVKHLLESHDQVMLIRGKAGTGKSTLLKEAREAIEAKGKRVYAFAPTSEASRVVLRQEGFPDANTVKSLLDSQQTQKALRGQVLLIDEAGLLGTPTLAKLFRIAEEQQARVILVGDTGQHKGVERGSALRELERQAGLPVVEVHEIQRQKGAYREAVASLAAGRAGEGFDQLNRLGWVHEIPDANERDQALAIEYAKAKEAGESALVVAPTHYECDRVTTAIRQELQIQGKLGHDEHQMFRLIPTQWTEAERSDAVRYQPGDVVQFVQNAKGFKRGERFTVTSIDRGGVHAQNATGKEGMLPLDQPDRFQVYQPSTLSVAIGDRLRITLGSKTRSGYRLNNGAIHTVAGFSQEGEILLDNGRKLEHKFGHLAYGYATTSMTAQGKTVDRVFVTQSQSSGKAASLEEFYVATSRGKRGVQVYVDDREAVRAMIARPKITLAASEVAAVQQRAPEQRHAEQRSFRRIRHFLRLANERSEALWERLREHTRQAMIHRDQILTSRTQRGYEYGR